MTAASGRDPDGDAAQPRAAGEPRGSGAPDAAGEPLGTPASPGAPAALIIARAPIAESVKPELAPLLDADRRAALQALLIRRAAAWAATAAPGAAFVAVDPPDAVEAVGALLPAGVRAFAQERGDPKDVLAHAIAHVARGPLLIAGTDCPRLGAAHTAAVLADLAAGCDVVIGMSLEGGWYLAGLREPRAELLSVAPDAWERGGGITVILGRARELRAQVGMLRHERLLVTPDDAAALLADPLLPGELRDALGG